MLNVLDLTVNKQDTAAVLHASENFIMTLSNWLYYMQLFKMKTAITKKLLWLISGTGQNYYGGVDALAETLSNQLYRELQRKLELLHVNVNNNQVRFLESMLDM